MKFLALAAALPLALAACTPGTFQCESPSTSPAWGWSVCDAGGSWVRGGSCGDNEYCSMNPNNGAPYCIEAPPREECSPGLYRCNEGDDGKWGIEECEGGKWVEIVECAEGEVCAYSAWGGNPYCTANPPWETTV